MINIKRRLEKIAESMGADDGQKFEIVVSFIEPKNGAVVRTLRIWPGTSREIWSSGEEEDTQ